jgi:hypothetical protein
LYRIIPPVVIAFQFDGQFLLFSRGYADRCSEHDCRKQFYVSISRARHDARIYTDDAEAVRRAVSRGAAQGNRARSC